MWALLPRVKYVCISLPYKIIGYFPLFSDVFIQPIFTERLLAGVRETHNLPLCVWSSWCAVIIELARSCSIVGAVTWAERGPAHKRQNFTGDKKSFSLSLTWERALSEPRNQNWRGGISWAEFCRILYLPRALEGSVDWICYISIQRENLLSLGQFGPPGSA